MTTETLRLHFRILVYAVPVFNVLVIALWVHGAVRSPRFRTGFILLACAAAFCAFPQLILGILQAQEDGGAKWFSKEIVRNLFSVMIIFYWLVMPFNLLGAVVILRQAMKSNEQSRNPTE